MDLKRSINRCFLLLALSTASCLAHSQAVVVHPSAPAAFDSIFVRVPEVFNDSTSSQLPYNTIDGRRTLVSMAGNRIRITVTLAQSDIPSPKSASLNVPVGQFPQGLYALEVIRVEPGGAAAGQIGTAEFIVSARQNGQPPWSQTDLWWTPSESGWGLNVIQRGLGRMFATWFVYDQSGAPFWYVVSDGQWVDASQFVGTVYRTRGPSIFAPFDPAQVTRTPVGTMTFSLHPTNADAAAVTFTIDGATVSKAVERLKF